MNDPLHPQHGPPPVPPPILPGAMPQHVLPLDGTPTIGSGRTILRFFVGFFVGAAISAVVWIAGWGRFVNHGSGAVILIVPGAKLIAGIVFLCFRGWRSLGAGILVSIAIGFLIFFGACAMHLGDMH